MVSFFDIVSLKPKGPYEVRLFDETGHLQGRTRSCGPGPVTGTTLLLFCLVTGSKRISIPNKTQIQMQLGKDLSPPNFRRRKTLYFSLRQLKKKIYIDKPFYSSTLAVQRWEFYSKISNKIFCLITLGLHTLDDEKF